MFFNSKIESTFAVHAQIFGDIQSYVHNVLKPTVLKPETFVRKLRIKHPKRILLFRHICGKQH